MRATPPLSEGPGREGCSPPLVWRTGRAGGSPTRPQGPAVRAPGRPRASADRGARRYRVIDQTAGPAGPNGRLSRSISACPTGGSESEVQHVQVEFDDGSSRAARQHARGGRARPGLAAGAGRQLAHVNGHARGPGRGRRCDRGARDACQACPLELGAGGVRARPARPREPVGRRLGRPDSLSLRGRGGTAVAARGSGGRTRARCDRRRQAIAARAVPGARAEGSPGRWHAGRGPDRWR